MSRQGHRMALPVCPKCGMDSGDRKVLYGSGTQEKYFVVCSTCGYMTKPHPTQTAATKEWMNK